jgi:hypothetical protein
MGPGSAEQREEALHRVRDMAQFVMPGLDPGIHDLF